ncbi:MAG: polyprenyl synthetase family protein [Lachnospiraceae bacterium]|nr:polyprenyl synthetase family protein [Lachnospiraceae bacterium]
MNFENELKKRQAAAEALIAAYLPEEEGCAKTVIEAMNYSVRVGGKRLRPVLMQAAYEAAGGKDTLAEPFMAAIEMIHTYSLVHDDLPEMYDDELRRGQPTTHVRYGQAMAVLAGDGLLNLAFETALKVFDFADEKERLCAIRALRILAGKAGIKGMVGGQCLDVEAEEKGLELTKEELLYVYANKTSALLEAALGCGAVLAGADEETVSEFFAAGYELGIAFQLQDDLLDIEGSTEELGKPVGSDERNGKKTYVSFLGIEEARAEQKRLSVSAAERIGKLKLQDDRQKEAAEFLKELIIALVSRRK